MPYTAEISRLNPSCLIFLIDQSGSMSDSFGTDPLKRKADGVADVINRLLQNLVLKCAKSEGVRDYYQVAVIGYGETVGPAFGGTLAGKELVPISEVAKFPMRLDTKQQKVDDGAGGLVEQTKKFPVWFDPVSKGGTPMCQTLQRVNMIASKWLSDHPSSFPPIVINITDGEATDGDPFNEAESLKSKSSVDGNVLLFNVHISSQKAAPIEFPDSDANLPDEFARKLFQMSSTLPAYMQTVATNEGKIISEKTRGFVFNADLVSVIQFLNIGTRATNLR